MLYYGLIQMEVEYFEYWASIWIITSDSDYADTNCHVNEHGSGWKSPGFNCILLIRRDNSRCF